jgi:penicillin V acylase-like amidase (Ntn superfamily)
MNLLSYLGPARNELELAVKNAGFESLKEYMDERKNEEMTEGERISYYLGKINVISEILQELSVEIGEEE